MAQPLTAEQVNDFDPLAEVYDQLVAWAPYEQWVEDLVRRMRRHGLEVGQSVLDAACGTGLSSVPLAKRGYRVTGVDCSQPMLEGARRRAEEAGVELELHRADLLEMDLGRRFDAVVCMHSGLDYILDLDRLQGAFRSLRRHVVEGGLFAFDKCLDEPEFYQESSTNSRHLEDGTAIFNYSWDREEKIFRQHCVVLREGQGQEVRRTEVVHKMLAVSVERLIEMLGREGFVMLERPEQFTISDPGMGIFRAV